MWAALFHDLAESVTGDLPAVTKWENTDLADQLEELEDKFACDTDTAVPLSGEELLLLSVADKLELVLFCTEQMLLGNKNAEAIRIRGIIYCHHQQLTDDQFNRMQNFIRVCANECK